MNSNLNLLPPEKRKILYNVYLLYFLKIIAELLLLYSAIVAVFLILARVILENDLKEFQIRTTSIETENKNINEQLKKINKTLQQANTVETNYADWSAKLLVLSNIKTEGIVLAGLDLTKEKNLITIQGKANTRQNLLDYQKNLENSGLIKNIEIPASVLTARENIDFEIKGIVNLK